MRSIVLQGRETAEFPAHTVVARWTHLLEQGWLAYLVCDGSPGLWGPLVDSVDPAYRPYARVAGKGERLGGTRALHHVGRRLRARALQRATSVHRMVARALAMEKPRLVHFPTGRTALDGLAAARLAGARSITTLGAEDLAAAGLDDSDHYEELWRHAGVIHVPDEGLWQLALERGCPEDRPHAVIAPAVGPEFVAPRPRDYGRPPGTLRVLSVGALDWTRGYEHALHAVRLLLDRGVDCEYRIVGEGEYDAAVAFARYQLGLEGRVELLEPLPPQDLHEHLAWADAFLSPAVVALAPGALLEAQATGLPAVVSDAGRDQASVNGSALVFPRRDPEALADRLAALAAESDLRRRLGEAGRERALAPPPAEQASAFEDLYRSALAP